MHLFISRAHKLSQSTFNQKDQHQTKEVVCQIKCFHAVWSLLGNLKVKSSHTCQSRRARASSGACSTWKPKENAYKRAQSRNKVLKVNSRKWSWELSALCHGAAAAAEVCKNPHLRFKNPAHDLKIPSHDRRFNYLINTARRRAVAHNLNKRRVVVCWRDWKRDALRRRRHAYRAV